MQPLKIFRNGTRTVSRQCGGRASLLTQSARFCTILQAQTPIEPIPKLNYTPLTDRLTGNASDFVSSSSYLINPNRVGRVTDVTNTIATVEGFTSAKPYTVVEFDNGVHGLVLSVDDSGCKIGILDHGTKDALLRPSDPIRLDHITNFKMQSPSTVVGPGIIGRIIDVYGNDFKYETNQPYSPPSPASSSENAAYHEPVYSVNLFPNSKYVTTWNTYARQRARIHTGIKSMDTFYPLARGSRTAIIGGPHHRKSELSIDILLSFLTHNDSTDNMRES